MEQTCIIQSFILFFYFIFLRVAADIFCSDAMINLIQNNKILHFIFAVYASKFHIYSKFLPKEAHLRPTSQRGIEILSYHHLKSSLIIKTEPL